ncbi:hypothetical protein GGX14DRAFT_566476 [Mycena pura]|uniref:Uncharacterized protein n=1 Tax=Mycena pura TaxID=153505 RepID=A0AAD6VGN6_9AGAR|nr:hypothetical protein GGX14DRAFT_566476 [Mycena pura]
MCTITIAEHRRRPRRTLRTLHIRLSKTFGAFGAPRPSAKLARTLFLTPQNTVNAPLLGPTPLPSESPAPFDRALGLVQARARCVNAPAYEELRRALGATLYNPTIARRELGAAAAHAARHAIARVRCLGGCSMRYSPHAFYAADPASRAQIRRGTLGVLTDACSSPRAAWTVRCAARSRLACPRCGGRRAVARARGPEHGREGTSPGAYPLGPPLLAKIVASLVTRYTFSTSSRQRLCSAARCPPPRTLTLAGVCGQTPPRLCAGPSLMRERELGLQPRMQHATRLCSARTSAEDGGEGPGGSNTESEVDEAIWAHAVQRGRGELRRALDAMLWNPTIAPREFGAAAAHAARRAIARVRGACAASERRLGADGAFPCPKLRERSMRHSLHTRCRRHPPQMLARRSRSTPTASLEPGRPRPSHSGNWGPLQPLATTSRSGNCRDYRAAGARGCSVLPRPSLSGSSGLQPLRQHVARLRMCHAPGPPLHLPCNRIAAPTGDDATDIHAGWRRCVLAKHPLLAGGSSDRGGEGRRDDATDEQRASTKLRVATRMCRCLPGLRNLAGPLCTARQVQRVVFGVEHPTAESSFGRVVALHQIEDEECLLDLEDADSLLDRVQDLVSQCMNDFPDDKINDDASKYAADMTKASITEGTRAGHSRQVV